MFYEQKSFLKLWVLVIAATVLAESALAAPPQGGLTGGARLHSGTGVNQRATRHVRHARDYSHGIYRYSRNVGRVAPVFIQVESEALGRNIVRAQQGFSTACQEARGNTATITALKSVEKHLESSAHQHKMLHEECCKPSVNGKVSMSCCSKIILDLDKAQAEHSALLRSSEIKAGKHE